MSVQEHPREDEIRKSLENHNNNITSQECKEANQALQAAYLWMKHRTEGLEERKYTESIIFFITGEGRITGWTAAAAQLVKTLLDDLQTINMNDFLKITDGRSIQDVVALVKPSFPYSIRAVCTNELQRGNMFTIKITSIVIEEKDLFFLVLYPDMVE
ncbi:MAG: hypothetical protein M0P74_15905 [Syntrophales bacterium]|jgi:hypothetical protein|nr:hypothetical protein [Syntrophales bacterium]